MNKPLGPALTIAIVAYAVLVGVAGLWAVGMTTGLVILVVAVWLACGIASGVIARGRGADPGEAVALGSLLGPIGLIYTLTR